jgi:choline dehydrogenase-like flavoprotein
MPQERNCVTLHPSENDQFNVPIPNVHFDDHPNDIAMRKHGFIQSAKVFEAVGATRIITIPPGPSTHNLGTCRQSTRPDDGVCNKWGQTHDISNLFISDGSQFTTGAAANPTLTIVALAIRQAEYIATRSRSKTSDLSLRPIALACLGTTLEPRTQCERAITQFLTGAAPPHIESRGCVER